ncbi:MAG: bifunctional sulfate adenylyltransferase/adenylylsulfate kinase [Spirochaetota bacterium]
MTDHLIEPHGGRLVNLLVDQERAEEIKQASRTWHSWDLTPRQMCDLELLINGGFSPLTGFMNKQDYNSVCSSMRLENGVLWPVPIVLDLPEEMVKKINQSDQIALRDAEGLMIAVLTVEDIYQPDKQAEAQAVYGTFSREHPGVAYLLDSTHPWYVGGSIEAVHLPEHYDYLDLRLTPGELRSAFSRMGWRSIIAFQTRNPMHRAHFELTMRAVREHEANLLIHPVVGLTKTGDIDHYTRVRCCKALMPHYPKGTAMLSLLPLAMRLAGPREALWHAIIRKNYGCTHFIVGRDHAGPGKDSSSVPFYGPYDAQELVSSSLEELGVKIVPFKKMVYVHDMGGYFPEDEVPEGKKTLSISGTELRKRLTEGRDIPSWFTFPEIIKELQKTHPPRSRQGFTVFFTGLSGAGKSTIAKGLYVRLMEIGGRPVTLLDGDIVRKNLSSELGFSKEHRDINIRRIGFVASEITKNRGVAICAPIAPYDRIRKQVREMISPLGGFILVYVSTPLEVCEARDRKGLYAKARAGIIKEFTGISDPYEPPNDADIAVDTTNLTPEEEVQKVVLHLEREGYISGDW